MPIYVWVRPDEMEVIQGRMAEAGISNLSAYIRKMALNGYIIPLGKWAHKDVKFLEITRIL